MLNTEYLGLKLKSPVIVSSGPLTQNAVSLKKCEEAGAGAVVLKSIFEEQIESDVSAEMEKNAEFLQHSSAEGFFEESSKNYYIDRYMKLLTAAKKELSIRFRDELGYERMGAQVDNLFIRASASPDIKRYGNGRFIPTEY